MTIAVIGDPHVMGNPSRFGGARRLGINERGWMTLDVLKRALERANDVSQKCVILGDLLDNMKPEPQLLSELRAVLRTYEGELFILKGNHDSASAEPGDNAIMVLRDEGICPVDEPMLVSPSGRSVLPDMILVPFRAGPIVEWLPGVLAEMQKQRLTDPERNCALFLHAGVKDAETAPWLRDSVGAIEAETLRDLMQRYGIKWSFHGDWHEHRTFEGNIHQVGALCPTGFNNLGITEYGNVAYLKPNGYVDYFYVHGPRFLQFGLGETPSVLKADDNKYFIEWTVPTPEFEASQLQLSALKASGVVEDGSVLPDGEAAQEGVREAASAAKSATNLEEGIAAYVSELVLDGDVDRKSVHARVRKYLGL